MNRHLVRHRAGYCDERFNDIEHVERQLADRYGQMEDLTYTIRVMEMAMLNMASKLIENVAPQAPPGFLQNIIPGNIDRPLCSRLVDKYLDDAAPMVAAELEKKQ